MKLIFKLTKTILEVFGVKQSAFLSALMIKSAYLSALMIKSTYLSALIIVNVIFFDVSHTPL